ncbi:MAG: type II toxin-antitoxin system RelE/ParE family toxin [Clostridium sp.]|nr:type II toxin-antitoxin system RelE/ParE family toxin [Clostridium sp.]
MDYNVIISDFAEAQLDRIIYHVLYRLKNAQAAQGILSDFKNTKEKLSRVAGSLKLCDDPHLQASGYRIIHLAQHQYFMVYRVENNMAYVEGIYHDLQDYENLLQ